MTKKTKNDPIGFSQQLLDQ